MPLTVQLFASLADCAGRRTVEILVPEGTTAAELWPLAVAACTGLRARPRPLVALNLEYALPGTVVREGDQIAFLPPVSGG